MNIGWEMTVGLGLILFILIACLNGMDKNASGWLPLFISMIVVMVLIMLSLCTWLLP